MTSYPARTLKALNTLSCASINVGRDPEIRIVDTETSRELHFVYKLSDIMGNAVDGLSLVSLQHKVAALLQQNVGTFWVGVYGREFHVWAALY